MNILVGVFSVLCALCWCCVFFVRLLPPHWVSLPFSFISTSLFFFLVIWFFSGIIYMLNNFFFCSLAQFNITNTTTSTTTKNNKNKICEANRSKQQTTNPESQKWHQQKPYEYFVDFIFPAIATFQFISHYVLFMVAFVNAHSRFHHTGIYQNTYIRIHIRSCDTVLYGRTLPTNRIVHMCHREDWVRVNAILTPPILYGIFGRFISCLCLCVSSMLLCVDIRVVFNSTSQCDAIQPSMLFNYNPLLIREWVRERERERDEPKRFHFQNYTCVPILFPTSPAINSLIYYLHCANRNYSCWISTLSQEKAAIFFCGKNQEIDQGKDILRISRIQMKMFIFVEENSIDCCCCSCTRNFNSCLNMWWNIDLMWIGPLKPQKHHI